MTAARVVLAVAGVALLSLAACGKADRQPILMNVTSDTNGPDEFAILPPKALELPEDLAAQHLFPEHLHMGVIYNYLLHESNYRNSF